MRIRRTFDSFEAYGWETPSHEIAEKVGLKTEQIVRLDTNTSPFAPLPELKLLSKAAQRLEVNQYPDTTYLDLRRGLAAYCGVGVDRFVVTNGADEGLDIIAKTLLDNGDEAVVPVPTYSMFRVVVEVMGARVRYARRNPDDYSIGADGVLEAVTPKTKVVFLCNPNSPTGNPMPLSEVEKVAREARAAVADRRGLLRVLGQDGFGAHREIRQPRRMQDVLEGVLDGRREGRIPGGPSRDGGDAKPGEAAEQPEASSR